MLLLWISNKQRRMLMDLMVGPFGNCTLYYRGIPLIKPQYHTSGLKILMNNKFVRNPVMQVSQLDI